MLSVLTRKRDYVREPAGTAEGGQFAKAGGSSHALDPKKKETWYRNGGEWRRAVDGERPYADVVEEKKEQGYEPPPVTHKAIRGANAGLWGGSHYGSQVITGESAKLMGIEGYRDLDATKEAKNVALRMVQAIAEDATGSEEELFHSFENTQATIFTPGDTMKLPLMATAGTPHTIYATRSEWESQTGAPTVFVFPVGTPMVGYSTPTLRDAKELDLKTIQDVHKEFGRIWDEAIVAGKFRVTKVETKYFGSQHRMKRMEEGDPIPQLYGQVVHLEPLETYNPVTKQWVPRG